MTLIVDSLTNFSPIFSDLSKKDLSESCVVIPGDYFFNFTLERETSFSWHIKDIGPVNQFLFVSQHCYQVTRTGVLREVDQRTNWNPSSDP